jgi:hypothetical protein
VPFLHRRADTEPAREWWSAVERYPGAAPGIVRELARCESVAADTLEIQQAVGWARAHPAWRDDHPPFVSQETIT